MNMDVATLTSKGQTTIPISVRKKLGLKQGDKIVFIEDTHGIRILNASAITITQPTENTE